VKEAIKATERRGENKKKKGWAKKVWKKKVDDWRTQPKKNKKKFCAEECEIAYVRFFGWQIRMAPLAIAAKKPKAIDRSRAKFRGIASGEWSLDRYAFGTSFHLR